MQRKHYIDDQEVIEKNLFITLSAKGFACIISTMVLIGVFHFCMSFVSASSFFASHTITSHRFTSPCMVAILLSCSGFSVSIMVTFHVSIFSQAFSLVHLILQMFPWLLQVLSLFQHLAPRVHVLREFHLVLLP